MKLKKTLKIQKGGLLNIKWNCIKEKCEFDDEKKSRLWRSMERYAC